MADLKTSIILDLAGNIDRQARRYAGSLGRLSSQGTRHMGRLSRSVSSFGRGIDRLGNRYTALITGAAGVGTLRMIGNLSERLTQLGVDAGMSADKVDELRQKIFDVSRAPDIRIDPDQLISAVEEIVTATGDLSFAERNLRNMGLVMRATASTGKDVGAMMTELQKLDKDASSENIMKALDVFIVQGKEGAVAMRDLASVGPRIFAAYASMRKGVSPETFIRELGAAVQTIKGGTGSVDQAATSFEALMRVFRDTNKLKALYGAGIKVFDPEALKEGREELRPINELMAEIVQKTQGRGTLLDSMIGDAEATRALQVSNLTENLRKYYNVQADGSTTAADAARNARELNAALLSLTTAGKDVAVRNLIEPIRELADLLDSLKPENVDLLFKAGAGIAATGAALVAGRKVYQGGRWLRSLFGKGGPGSAAGGMAAGAFGDAIPVYVVNGPSSIWPGGGTAGKPGASKVPAAGSASLMLGASPMLPAALTAVVASASIAVGEKLARREAMSMSTDRLKELRSRHMVMGGGGDSFQVKTIDSELARRMDEGMQGTLKIDINAPGPTRVTEMTGKNLDLEVSSGKTMTGY